MRVTSRPGGSTPGGQRHVQHVVSIGAVITAPAAVADRQHVLAAGDHPFGEQKALREFDIRAGRAHRDRDRRPVDADLQRLLDGQGFRPGDRLIGAEMPCPPTRGYVAHWTLWLSAGAGASSVTPPEPAPPASPPTSASGASRVAAAPFWYPSPPMSARHAAIRLRKGRRGNREIAADAAEAAAAGTRTGRPPSALATSAIDTSPSPAMLYAPAAPEQWPPARPPSQRRRGGPAATENPDPARPASRPAPPLPRPAPGRAAASTARAFANAGAWGPATMHGRSTNTPNGEPLVMSASTASHAAFCSE